MLAFATRLRLQVLLGHVTIARFVLHLLLETFLVQEALELRIDQRESVLLTE